MGGEGNGMETGVSCWLSPLQPNTSAAPASDGIASICRSFIGSYLWKSKLAREVWNGVRPLSSAGRCQTRAYGNTF